MSKSDTKSLLPEWLVVGFTGHRQLADPVIVKRALDTLLSDLNIKYGSITGISSAASGADTLFLEACQQQNVASSIILPFEQKRFADDFAVDEWHRVLPLLERAIETTITSHKLSDEDAYLDAGLITVERCDLMVAVWNGKPATGKGGTAEIVEYTRRRSMPLIIIDPETGNTTHERVDSTADNVSTPSPDAITDYYSVVQAVYDGFDRTANKYGSKTRNLALTIILLHLFASAVAIGAVALGSKLLIGPGIKVLALILALALVGLHHRIQKHWTNSRPAAELCRMFLAIWRMDRHFGAPPSRVLRSHPRLFKNLSLAWRMDQRAELPLSEAKQAYLRQRIIDQLDYYQTQLARSLVWQNRLLPWTRYSMYLAIIAGLAVIIMMLASIHKNPDSTTGIVFTWVKLLSILFPLCVAALLSVLVSQDTVRRVVRYREMIDHLQAAKDKFLLVSTWPALWRVVVEVETTLLSEIDEWNALTLFSEST